MTNLTSSQQEHCTLVIIPFPKSPLFACLSRVIVESPNGRRRRREKMPKPGTPHPSRCISALRTARSAPSHRGAHIRAIKQGRPHPQPFPSPFPRSGRRVIPPPPLETALARANPHMTAHLLPPAGSAGFWLFSISPIMSSKAFVTFSL